MLRTHLSMLTAKELDDMADDSLSHLIFLVLSVALNGLLGGVGGVIKYYISSKNSLAQWSAKGQEPALTGWMLA